MQIPQLHTIDLVIIAAYLLFVILLGVYLSKRQKNESDYFLAGRSLTWPIVGFSLFASNMGSNSLVGLAGSGYKMGFAIFSYEWMASFVLILFAVFFLPFFLKNKIFTVPEMLEKRYNKISRIYFSIITILLNVFIDTAATLFAGSLVIQMAFPDISLTTIIWGIAIIAAFYTMLGGLASVVYSDVVQAILLIFGSIVLTYIAYTKVGGWDNIVANIDAKKLTIIQASDHPDLPWPALFSGVFILGFYFWITNQFIAQRALASKNTMQGQWGALFAGFLKLSVLFIMILPGVIGIMLYPNIENPDKIYPTMVFSLLPTGVLGLVLAGFIAALMSSVDSSLNSAATLLSMDFYRKIWPNVSPTKMIKMAKFTIVILTIVAAIWAPYINQFPSLWDYLQMILSFICPPIAALYIIGLFTSKVNGYGATATIAIGIILSIVSLFYMNAEWMPHYLYLAGFIFIICVLVLLSVSYFYRHKEQKDLTNLIWTMEHYRAESKTLAHLPFYKNYRYQSIGLLFLIAVLLIIF